MVFSQSMSCLYLLVFAMNHHVYFYWQSIHHFKDLKCQDFNVHFGDHNFSMALNFKVPVVLEKEKSIFVIILWNSTSRSSYRLCSWGLWNVIINFWRSYVVWIFLFVGLWKELSICYWLSRCVCWVLVIWGLLICDYQELGNLQKNIHETWGNVRSSISLVVFWEALKQWAR